MEQYSLKNHLESTKAVLIDYKKDLRRYTKLAESYAKKRDAQKVRVFDYEEKVKKLTRELNKEVLQEKQGMEKR